MPTRVIADRLEPIWHMQKCLAWIILAALYMPPFVLKTAQKHAAGQCLLSRYCSELLALATVAAELP